MARNTTEKVLIGIGTGITVIAIGTALYLNIAAGLPISILFLALFLDTFYCTIAGAFMTLVSVFLYDVFFGPHVPALPN